jgi:hypothetical protein
MTRKALAVTNFLLKSERSGGDIAENQDPWREDE